MTVTVKTSKMYKLKSTTCMKYKNSSFKGSERIQKKECGPDRSVSDNGVFRSLLFGRLYD